MTPDIAALTRDSLLWRGKQAAHHITTLSSGHTVLDAALPGHGWPLGAVTEIIHDVSGCGELSLLMPALARIKQAEGQAGRHLITMIDPPWIPYPPALHSHGLALDSVLMIRTQNRKESLWACEQVLRGMPDGAMLAWPERLTFSESRRLQLAAESGQKAVFLFRDAGAANTSSPAALRIQLAADNGELQIKILKCRGQRPTTAIRIRHMMIENPDPCHRLRAM